MNSLIHKLLQLGLRIHGHFLVDKNENAWDLRLFHIEIAINYSQTLTDCYSCINCINCELCMNCIHCVNCYGCEDCSYSREILKCSDSHYCESCSYVNGSVECLDSFDLDKEIGCEFYNILPKETTRFSVLYGAKKIPNLVRSFL